MAPKKNAKSNAAAEAAKAAQVEAEHQDAVEMADETVNAIVDEAAAVLEENALQRKQTPFTSAKVIGEMLKVVEFALLTKDRGELEFELVDEQCEAKTSEESKSEACDKEQVDKLRETFFDAWCLPEDEPESCPIDSWATGVVPLKKVVKQKYSKILSTSPTAPSESGFTKRSGWGKKSRRADVASISSGDDRKSSFGGDKSSKKSASQFVINVVDDVNATEFANSNGKASPKGKKSAIYKVASPKMSAEELLRLKTLKEIEEKLKADKLQKEQRIREEREEKEKADRLARELKGKDYTFDHDGNVIIISAVNGDKLPSNTFNVITSTRVVSETEQASQTKDHSSGNLNTSRSKRSNYSSGSSRSKSKKDKDKSKSEDSEFFENCVSFQQRVLKNPELQLQPGVTIREGGAGSSGAKKQEDPQHMSRRLFMQHQAQLELQSASIANLASPTKTANSSLVPDLRLTQPGGDSLKNTNTARSHLSTHSKQSPKQARPRQNDPNVALLEDPDWGKNPGTDDSEYLPPKVHHKPEPHLLKATFQSSIKVKPRDRHFTDTKLQNEKQHSAAPPMYQSVVSPGARSYTQEELESFPPIHTSHNQHDDALSPGSLASNGSPLVGNGHASNGFINIKSDRAKRLLGIVDNKKR